MGLPYDPERCRAHEIEFGTGGHRLGCKLLLKDGSLLFVHESQITPEIESLMANLGSPTIGLGNGDPGPKTKLSRPVVREDNRQTWDSGAFARETIAPGVVTSSTSGNHPRPNQNGGYCCPLAALLGVVSPLIPIGSPETTISTRRFRWRPASVEFDATGSALPSPTAITFVAGTPCPTR